MTTAHLLSKIPLVGSLTLVLLFAGCGSDPPWGEGKDGVPDIIEDDSDLDTFWVGSLGVDELDQKTGEDPGHTTLVQAHFSDFTHYRVFVTDRKFFSEACSVPTGRQTVVKYCTPEAACSTDADCATGSICREERCLPEFVTCQGDAECPGILVCAGGMCMLPECQEQGECEAGFLCLESRAITLGADQVTIAGLDGGPLNLTPDGETGRFGTEVLPGRAFADPMVSFTVSAGGGTWDFPAFQDEVPVPIFPVLKRLGEVRDPDLASGPSIGITEMREESFIVEWEASNADYVEFKILPGAGSDTKHMKLRCITFDDGGLEIPADALRDLALDQATNFQVKLERHNFTLHSVKDGDVVQAAALIDVSSAVEGTVLR